MSLAARLRALIPGRRPLVPREHVNFRPIGIVRNHVASSRPHGWQDVRSDIFLSDELEPSLDGLQDFSHVIVVFYMDKVPDEERRLRLPVGADAAERGIFATRSQRRPNGIGVSVVRLLHRRRGVLRVQGLDAIDGTVVLDLKPYLPMYDAVPEAQIPSWARIDG